MRLVQLGVISSLAPGLGFTPTLISQNSQNNCPLFAASWSDLPRDDLSRLSSVGSSSLSFSSTASSSSPLPSPSPSPLSPPVQLTPLPSQESPAQEETSSSSSSTSSSSSASIFFPTSPEPYSVAFSASISAGITICDALYPKTKELLDITTLDYKLDTFNNDEVSFPTSMRSPRRVILAETLADQHNYISPQTPFLSPTFLSQH